MNKKESQPLGQKFKKEESMDISTYLDA